MKPTTLYRWLAVATAWSLVSWWGESRLLLSDEGLYATARFVDGVRYPGRWSAFDVFSSSTAVRMVICFVFIVCVALFAKPTGRGTAARLFILFVCAASLNARAPFAISSAEMYLAVLLFWAVLGSTLGWSVHMLRAFRVQIALVYLSPLLIRFLHGGETWIDGSALRLVVGNADGRRGPFGSLVRHAPEAVLSTATWGAIVVESAVAVLLVALVVTDRIPDSARRRISRPAVMLHVCIALVCGLWFFSAVAIVGLLAAVRLEPGERTTARLRIVPWSVAACVVVWTFLSISESPATAAGQQRNIASYVVRAAGITQVWGVFSPNPPRVERWVEIVDGAGDVLIDSRGEGGRIRKLAQNVRSSPDGPLARAWLTTLCGTGVVSLDVVTGNSDVRSTTVSLDCPVDP
ncbi:MAG: hypothetical protein KGQ43_08880 [Acidobacteria bacterium]|nr:hypothetical protein [Acidobacteriota bacterium]